MQSIDVGEIREVLERLGRLAAAEEWSTELNPAQRAALDYLARANRFSRTPSTIADYLCTTRGTASQTLKALERKGLVEARRSAADKRSISYDLTPAGHEATEHRGMLESAIADLPTEMAENLHATLRRIARDALRRRGNRAFGHCRTCRHNGSRPGGAYCTLLDVALEPHETGQICHEHQE
ncbi:MAG: MarR family transcriptional regulator [Pseudomonadota bacterium]